MSGAGLFEAFVDEYSKNFLDKGWSSFEIGYNSHGERMFFFDISQVYPGALRRGFPIHEDAGMNFYLLAEELRALEVELRNNPDRLADIIYCDLVVYERPLSGLQEECSLHNKLVAEGKDAADISDFYHGAFKRSDAGVAIYNEILSELIYLDNDFANTWELYMRCRDDFFGRNSVSQSDLHAYIEASPMTEYKRYMDIGWLN